MLLCQTHRNTSLVRIKSRSLPGASRPAVIWPPPSAITSYKRFAPPATRPPGCSRCPRACARRSLGREHTVPYTGGLFHLPQPCSGVTFQEAFPNHSSWKGRPTQRSPPPVCGPTQTKIWDTVVFLILQYQKMHNTRRQRFLFSLSTSVLTNGAWQTTGAQ